MPKEWEQRPGETFEAWWCRVNEIVPEQGRGTLITEVS